MRSTTQPPGDMTSQPVLLPARRSGAYFAEELGVVEQALVVLDLDARSAAVNASMLG